MPGARNDTCGVPTELAPDKGQQIVAIGRLEKRGSQDYLGCSSLKIYFRKAKPAPQENVSDGATPESGTVVDILDQGNFFGWEEKTAIVGCCPAVNLHLKKRFSK